MDGKTFARLGAVVFIGVAIAATAIEASRKDDAPMEPPAERILTRPADPLRAELIRCQLLGEGGSRDSACLRAWAENRRRFLGRSASTAAPAPSTPITLFPGESNAAEPAAAPSQPTPSEAR